MLLLSAQAQYVQHFGEREGLSSRMVQHALRTSDGYLWVATYNGLNRFNGYEFLHFNKTNTHKLTSNFITCILEDTNKVLWVATDNGINLLDLKSHQIVQVFQQGKTQGHLSSNYVLQIFQSSDKTIWISTVNGMLHQYLGAGKFKQFKNPYATDGTFGYRLKITEYKNNIWLKTMDRGLFRLDKVQGRVVSNYLSNQKSNDESGIGVIPKYGLVAMFNDGVKVYDDFADDFKPLLLPGIQEVFSMVADEMNNIWVTAVQRKRLFKVTDGKAVEVTSQLFDFSENVHISSICVGKSNDLWICTNNGLFKLINEQSLFSYLLTKSQVKEKLYSPSFRGMLQTPNGDVFIGGYGGLFKLSNSRIKKLLNSKIPWSPSILMDCDNDFIWMISEGFGLLKVNKKNGQIVKHQRDRSRYNYLISGVQEQNGIFLLGGYDELVWYNSLTNQYSDYNLYFKGQHYLRPNVRYIFKSSLNELWVCTNHGVFVLDNNRKIKARYAEDEKSPYQIKVNQVYHISEDLQHRLWLSTNGGGVICLNNKGKIIRKITSDDGLADNRVAFSICDSSNRLWIGTFNGLTSIDQNNQTVNYHQEHGISSNEFNAASLLYRKDGTIMMGTINGINLVEKKWIKPLSLVSGNEIVISSVEILDDKNEIKQVYDEDAISKGVQLKQKTSYLAISFFNTDFRHADKNIFFYKLQGLNNNWIPLGDKNYIRFATLTAGDYTLHIKGISAGNTKEAKGASFKIKVEEVFYRTWWFILIGVFFLALMLFFMVNLRVQKIKEVLLVRSKISNDLHDDVGSVLTRVAMQAELLQEEVGKEQQATLNNIIKTCRTAMSNMRDVIWSSDVRYNNIGNLFDKITEMVQQTMEQSNIAYKLNYDEEVKRMKISPDNKQEIFFIMKEAFHNIVKHCKGDVVELNVYRVKDQLVFSVYNNGTVAQKQLQTSSGLNNMYMRATRIKANFTIDVTDGFLVKLIIPIKKKLFL
jgi:ligand-binding sensor domain-containing protein